MASADSPALDLFLPGGRIRFSLFTPSAIRALERSIEMTRKTCWDNVRSPHLFMALLSTPDPAIENWGGRLQADLSRLLDQFLDLFHQVNGLPDAVLALHREFLSDNVIRVLRESVARARSQNRDQVTTMDLLIAVLTTENSIVGECFERIGLPPNAITEHALEAERQGNDKEQANG